MKVAVVGYGYWGPNLVRNFVRRLGRENVIVCDLDEAGRARALHDHPGIGVVAEMSEFLADPAVAAIVIATPAGTHYRLADAALRAGKHVLVEKPMAMSAAEGEALQALAAERRLILMSDLTFLFNPAVTALKALVDEGRLGRIEAMLSNRLNLGQHRTDVDVIWNLYIHDLSIFQYWLGTPPESIMAMGRDLLGTGQMDIAFLAARYPQGTVAQVNASLLAPRKAREITVIGSTGMAVFDDAAPQKLLLYDTRAELSQGRVNYFRGVPEPVAIDSTEALAHMVGHFLNCIRDGQEPVTGAAFSLEILRTLEATERALSVPGTPVAPGGRKP